MNISSGCCLSNGQSASPEVGMRSNYSVPRAQLGLQADSAQDRVMSSSSKSNPRSLGFQGGALDPSHHLICRHQNKNGNNSSYSDLAPEGPSSCTGVDLIAPALLLNEALCKYATNLSSSVPEANFPDDSKLLANPKGIIKSYLPQASALSPEKFESYRRLCLSHVKEYFKHQKGGLGAVCLLCNMSCKHWNTLQRHLQTHLDFRPFACDTCGRTFYSQSKLKRHQVVHSEVKPYKCPVCDRRLGRTEHLKRHLLVHTDRKPYGCSSCSHTTKRLDGIRRHIKRKHGGGSAEIVALALPMDQECSLLLPPVLSTSDASGPKPKKSKKKKKKTVLASNAESGCDADQRDAFSGNLLDVAASFGVKDLKMPGPDVKPFDEKDAKHVPGHEPRSGEGLPEDLKPVWDPNQMLLPSQQMQQLIYQSLVRVHPSAANAANLGDVSSRSMAPAMPVMAAAARPPFQLNHGNPLSHPNDAFCVNGSGVATVRYPASVTSAGEGSSRNSNVMMLSPGSSRANIAACYGQMDAGTEMMISQYFQSHQRFAPPVWGFANPNYHGY